LIGRQANFFTIWSFHSAVSAEQLQCRPNAGKDKIGTANSLSAKAIHPVTDALGQIANNIAPVTNPCIHIARATD
jgi:hypothetical protein